LGIEFKGNNANAIRKEVLGRYLAGVEDFESAMEDGSSVQVLLTNVYVLITLAFGE